MQERAFPLTPLIGSATGPYCAVFFAPLPFCLRSPSPGLSEVACYSTDTEKKPRYMVDAITLLYTYTL